MRAVLPGMRERGAGTLLLAAGASSVRNPGGGSGSTGIAAAALRNYTMALGAGLAGTGIDVAHIAIGVFTGGSPGNDAGSIATRYRDAHVKRDQAEIIHAGPGSLWNAA